jgi:DNA polymerase V
VDTVYRDFPPRIGIYPIDGSFLDISDVRQRDREFLARDMRATVSGGDRRPLCGGVRARA